MENRANRLPTTQDIKRDFLKFIAPISLSIILALSSGVKPANAQEIQNAVNSSGENTTTYIVPSQTQENPDWVVEAVQPQYTMEPKPEQDNLDLLTPTSPSSGDLVVENYNACIFNTGQPYPNDRAGNYSYTIINEGTSQSPPSEALVNFQPFPYEAADSTSIPALNPGQSYPVSGVVDFNICTTCPYVNTHFFADFGQSIVETDETNNVRNMITDTCPPQKKVHLPLVLG